ncbi:hypothetical protein ACLOJK_017084 [Asimina triloba]
MKFIPTTLSILLLYMWMAVQAPCVCSQAVLDVQGKNLQPNVDYYILPVIRGRGGGLALATRNGSCPLSVAQERFEVSNGLPLTFRPVNSRDKVVSLSTDMNVVFSAVTICVQSTAWSLSFDKATNRRYVSTGGEIGNPGRSTLSNWFKIEKYNNKDYKLVFCPGVCDFCKVICGDLGIFVEDGRRWLGFNGTAFPVMFKKA